MRRGATLGRRWEMGFKYGTTGSSYMYYRITTELVSTLTISFHSHSHFTFTHTRTQRAIIFAIIITRYPARVWLAAI